MSFKKITGRVKEWSNDRSYDMREASDWYAKWEKPGAKDHSVQFHRYEMSMLGKSIKLESQFVVVRGQRELELGVTANRHGISLRDDENVF